MSTQRREIVWHRDMGILTPACKTIGSVSDTEKLPFTANVHLIFVPWGMRVEFSVLDSPRKSVTLKLPPVWLMGTEAPWRCVIRISTEILRLYSRTKPMLGTVMLTMSTWKSASANKVTMTGWSFMLPLYHNLDILQGSFCLCPCGV